MKAVTFAAVTIIAISGVATAGKPWEAVRVVPDAAQVEGCEYIGEVKNQPPDLTAGEFNRSE